MKKCLVALVLIVFIIPSVALASWWNPFSWFNNWSFKKDDTQIEVLERRIQELESILEEPSEEKSINNDTNEEGKESIPKEKKKVENKFTPQVTPTPVPTNTTVKPDVVVKTINPDEVRCKLNSERDIEKGDSRKAILSALSLGITSYEIDWDEKYLSKVLGYNEALFTFNAIGPIEVFATVTRKEDGAIGKVTCLKTIIPCDGYYCLNDTEKKKYKLNQIISEIDSWYEFTHVTDICLMSESIIRALEYDYTLMGGLNLPVFSPEQDCSSTIAPAAYKYKIQLLMDSF